MTTLMQHPAPPRAGRPLVPSTRPPLRPLPLVRACRPHQWVKNALVFAVPFAAGQLLVAHVALSALLAAVVFVLASSATYLINDAGDVEADRRHPTKRLRPIAAGTLSVGQARGVAIVLLVTALVGAAAMSTAMVVLIAAYLTTTTCYSRWLKRVPVLDVVVVASGFLLRALAGGGATGLAMSPLFLATAAGGALFIVTGKRLGEVIELGAGAAAHRSVLTWYTPARCRRLLGLALATSGGAFAVWALRLSEPGGLSALQRGAITMASLAIVPFVAGAARAWHLITAGRGADPLSLLTHDRVLPALGLACGLLVAAAIYL